MLVEEEKALLDPTEVSCQDPTGRGVTGSDVCPQEEGAPMVESPWAKWDLKDAFWKLTAGKRVYNYF